MPAAMQRHGTRTQAPPELIQEPTQMGHPTAQVLLRIPGVSDPKTFCRLGDELHQPWAFLGDRAPGSKLDST